MLRNLSLETKKYILLHAKIDNLNQLESALHFYDSNLRILDFQDRSGKGEHANFSLKETRIVLTGGKNNKGKDKGKDNKGKEKEKDKDGKSKGKGDEKGKNGKGNKSDQKKDKGKHQGAAATSSKDGAEKDQATKTPAWKKVDGLSKTATGEQAEGTDPGPKHTDPRNTDGDGPRGEAREAGRRGEVVCPAPGTPRQPQPVRSPVSSSGPEHSGGTSRSHHPCGGGDHRQDQLYKSDTGSSSAPASSSAARCDNGRTWRDSAGVTEQLLFGDGTRGTEDTTTRGTKDARRRDSSRGDARSIHTAKNDPERQQEGTDLGIAEDWHEQRPRRPPREATGFLLECLGTIFERRRFSSSMCRGGFHQPSSTCSLSGG